MSEITDKVFIAETAENNAVNKLFPFRAFCWGLVVNNDYTGIADPDLDLETTIGFESDIQVLTVQVNSLTYTRVDTEAEVITTQAAFFYDDSTRFLLIHFQDNKSPYDYDENAIQLGLTVGFYKSSGEVIGEWNGQAYYNRLLSFPEIKKEKDDFYFSKQVFPDGKVSFDNGDYRFKKFTIGKGVSSRAGNFVRVLFWEGNLDDGEPSYSDFEVTYQGTIKKISEGNTIDLVLQDIRTTLDKKTPVTALDNSNFADLKSPNKEFLIPQIWGKCFRVPCLSLDENINKGTTSGPFDDYRFMLCDSTLTGYSDNNDDTVKVTIASDAIKAVYIDGVEVDGVPTVSEDTTNGIYYFTLDYENFYNADDGGSANFKGQNKVSVDVEGYLDDSNILISNGLQIIRELLYQNYAYTYIDTFYNTTTWASFETTAYKCGVYLQKPNSVQKIIGEISNSQLGEFIWDENLKFTYNNDDFVSLAAEVSKNELFPEDFIPFIDHDTSEVLAKFRTGVRKRWDTTDKEDSFDWVVDSTNESAALTDFNSSFQKDFETLLYDDTDIDNYKTRVHFFGDISNDTVTISIPWDYKDLDKGQYIAVEYDLPNQGFVGWIMIQITLVVLNVEEWKVEIEGRIFEYGPYFTLLESAENALLTEHPRSIIIKDFGSLAT